MDKAHLCWCSAGKDLPGFGNEPVFGDSLEGSHERMVWGPSVTHSLDLSKRHFVPRQRSSACRRKPRLCGRSPGPRIDRESTAGPRARDADRCGFQTSLWCFKGHQKEGHLFGVPLF